MFRENFHPEIFVFDVDGVLTDGTFVYSAEGKIHKTFGADDADGLQLMSQYLPVRIVSADKRGFPISRKRIVEDMGLSLDLVSSKERTSWIASIAPLDKVIYMGDGFYDGLIFAQVGYGIAPANALDITKEHADYVTRRRGGDRAAAEACLHVIERFFGGAGPVFALSAK